VNRGRIAAGSNVFVGAWALVQVWAFPTVYACPNGGCPASITIPPELTLLFGVLLIADGLICFARLRAAFYAGGLLSVVMAVLVLYQWTGATPPNLAFVALPVVSLLALIADILALSSKSKLAEQQHPMNLPVFG
jgi:hypothetical protein